MPGYQKREKSSAGPKSRRPKSGSDLAKGRGHKSNPIRQKNSHIGRIKKWGINGEGITYLNGKVVFVEGAIPDELVEYEIDSHKGSYYSARIKRILEPSPRRRIPMCALQDQCGGCSIMHLDYRGQIRMKEAILKEALKKYAGYNGKILPMIKNPTPMGYRNSIKMPFGKKEELSTGMYERGSNHFIPVEECRIHAPKLEKVRKEITRLAIEHDLDLAGRKEDGLLTLVLKEYNDQVYVVLVTSDYHIPEAFQEAVLNLEDVASLWQSIKKKSDPEYELYGKRLLHLGGDMQMNLDLEDIQLTLLPRSFFQLNTKQAIALYKLVADWVGNAKVVVEAYCGVGAISLFLADQVEEVIGIELIEDAVENARQNALENGKDNAVFICGDAGKEMDKIIRSKHVDVIVIDPPRKGIDEPMKKALKKSGAEKIIYISCNPSTLGKDIADLSRKYHIVKVQPFDMFSQTPHVETVVLLEKNR